MNEHSIDPEVRLIVINHKTKRRRQGNRKIILIISSSHLDETFFLSFFFVLLLSHDSQINPSKCLAIQERKKKRKGKLK